ncbi:MAG: hypothetical protein E4H14_13600 [Candidatus Thorarchaeota archaeon]|nr:MAG: hypothetical protein E4H14_13600 [Candidatus Thorarchaeota archaeon]
MKNNVTRFGLLFVILFSVITFCDVTMVVERRSTIVTSPFSVYVESQYSPHDPIVITSNQDFVDQGWPGNGIKNDPYVIQDLTITSIERSISISSTDVYFKIIDCYFSNDTEQNNCIGVSLEEADNGVIENCTFFNLYYGVYIHYSDNISITFNEMDSVDTASINLFESKGCEVLNNSISNIGNWGISARRVTDVLFANNSFSNEFYGMKREDSVNCTLKNNEFEKVGLWIRGTESDHFLSNIFESNTVETKPISILTNRSSETIDASLYGQLFLFNSSHCIVENAIFNDRNAGVSLAICNDCLVQNLNSSYSQICLVELQLCNNTEVVRCNVAESYNAGFRFLFTINCSLIECKTGYSPSNTVYGIEIYNTENTTIARNFFQAGGVLSRDSANCSIIDNNVEGNGGSQGPGFYISSSHNFTIKENELSELYTGLLFGPDSTNCTILNNRIHDNQWYGIDVEETCEGFRIYNNSFWYNDLGHAIDNGNSNYWYDGISLGNQWDDYNGTGVYNIPGSAGSVDHFPRADPYHTRTITIATTTSTTNQTSGGTSNLPIELVILGIGVSVIIVVMVVLILVKKR